MEFKPNKRQYETISYDGNQPLLIEAGPGSRKTLVIIERVNFLVNTKK